MTRPNPLSPSLATRVGHLAETSGARCPACQGTGIATAVGLARAQGEEIAAVILEAARRLGLDAEDHHVRRQVAAVLRERHAA